MPDEANPGPGDPAGQLTPKPLQDASAEMQKVQTPKVGSTFPSTSDTRVTNNVMRHAYKVLSDTEKMAMQKMKDDGLALWQYVDSLGSSREVSVAKTKIEEAVMWAVKHITG